MKVLRRVLELESVMKTQGSSWGYTVKIIRIQWNYIEKTIYRKKISQGKLLNKLQIIDSEGKEK